jgi:hypothetical protein
MLADAYSSRSPMVMGSASARWKAFGDEAHFLGRREVLDEHRELVAAQPRQGVTRTQVRFEAARDGDEKLVAHHVPGCR